MYESSWFLYLFINVFCYVFLRCGQRIITFILYHVVHHHCCIHVNASSHFFFFSLLCMYFITLSLLRASCIIIFTLCRVDHKQRWTYTRESNSVFLLVLLFIYFVLFSLVPYHNLAFFYVPRVVSSVWPTRGKVLLVFFTYSCTTVCLVFPPLVISQHVISS